MRQLRSSCTVLCAVLALAMISCAAPESGSSEPEPAAAAPPMPAPGPKVMERDGLKLTAMPGSPSFPGATLSLTLPAALEAGSNVLSFEVENYELGVQTADAGVNGLANSGDGQHIHLIVDNGPYSAHYDADVEVELAEGQHVILAFLSRSYHESVKEPTAYVVQQVVVGSSEGDEVDLAAPHLFYSRPKGSYQGADTERLMLDFYLVNAELSPDGYRVRATINGTEFELTEWVPWVIEGLPLGEVEIGLELVDVDGAPVPGPFNRVTRTVTLGVDEAS